MARSLFFLKSSYPGYYWGVRLWRLCVRVWNTPTKLQNIRMKTELKHYVLWLRLSTSRDFALSKPSGTSLSRLWDRSSVVSSSRRNRSAGSPELFTLLWRMFSDLRQCSSVISPYNFSRLFLFSDKFSCTQLNNL